jgi:membrane protein DedA with SNARE-associated domain
MLHFIDEIVIPFLNSLYGAVGYLGVMVAMAIESAMIPLPSELILPYAGFLISDPNQLEPLTNGPWSFWITVVVATIGNTLGSLIAYAIGAYGGRPFLERYGRYLLIRQHEIDLAERFFERWGRATVFVSRLMPVVRTFISFPAGVVRMPLRPFIIYSTAGALLWSILLVWVGEQLGANWAQIREMLQPYDTLMIALVVVAGVLFVWWRLGMPGLPRRGAPGPPPDEAAEPSGPKGPGQPTSGEAGVVHALGEGRFE